jgi:hypothetical protein
MSTDVQQILIAVRALRPEERQELAIALDALVLPPQPNKDLILAVRGKYAHVPTSSDAFMARKHEDLALPFTHNRRWTKSLISQRKPEAHELKCGVALPDQLMTGRWVVVASEISADLRDQAYRFTQQHG